MSDYRWAVWASLCVAWSFSLAGYWWALHMWPLSAFAIVMGAFSQNWAFLCWREHLRALAKSMPATKEDGE